MDRVILAAHPLTDVIDFIKLKSPIIRMCYHVMALLSALPFMFRTQVCAFEELDYEGRAEDFAPLKLSLTV